MPIRFITALENTLVELKQPVISSYAVFLHAYKLDTNGSYKGESLYRQRDPLTRHKVSSLTSHLKENKVIKPDPDFSMGIYRINEVPDGASDEICSFVDPFCYLSHLSAMRRFGITDRMPSGLTLTTPHREIWNDLRDQLVARDFAGLEPIDMTSLKQLSFPEQVRGIRVHRHETKYPAATITIHDSPSRISNIGSTFVDTLDKPSLCGGMEHVLEVWQEYAKSYLDEIITSVTSFPKKIIKVRAGYILDELLHINDDRIKQWLTVTQRGSSQVLDPEKPFRSNFSEKWMLSLNV